MSYERYKNYRLAPDDNGCWDLLDSNYESVGTFPSQAAAKRHADELEHKPVTNHLTLDEILTNLLKATQAAPNAKAYLAEKPKAKQQFTALVKEKERIAFQAGLIKATEILTKKRLREEQKT